MRPRVRHELKCWPEFFQPTLNAHKRFELRRDDRPEGFQVGDHLLLKEWVPENRSDLVPPTGYTGREVLVRVDYIMPREVMNRLTDTPSTYMNFVIMSISVF